MYFTIPLCFDHSMSLVIYTLAIYERTNLGMTFVDNACPLHRDLLLGLQNDVRYIELPTIYFLLQRDFSVKILP